MEEKKVLEISIKKCKDAIATYNRKIAENDQVNADYKKKLVSFEEKLPELSRAYADIVADENKEMTSRNSFVSDLFHQRQACKITVAPVKPIVITSKALPLIDWLNFIKQVDKENARNGLIIRLLLSNDIQVSTIVRLRLADIDMLNKTITFRHRLGRRNIKRAALFRNETIKYPEFFIEDLKTYINSSKHSRTDSGFVFITCSGKPVVSGTVYKTMNDLFSGMITPEILYETYRSFIALGIPAEKYLK